MTDHPTTATLGLLGNQSLSRSLTPAEQHLAAALEQVFASGCHDFAVVAQNLQDMHVARPSGESAPWTPEVLEAELRRINDSLDAAYANRHARQA